MLELKYIAMVISFGMLALGVGLVAHDIWLAAERRRLLGPRGRRHA
ncbi:MAG TPA: hypothetical protein VNL38_00355 [Candidatus Nitrosotenuis sp.]|nr:hypothetical protein [Candidatus Nitrosotenuis sp.]